MKIMSCMTKIKLNCTMTKVAFLGAQRIFPFLLTAAFIFSFASGSCDVHSVNDKPIAVPPAHSAEQCVAHKLHAKPVETGTLSKLNVPLPEPFKFLPVIQVAKLQEFTHERASRKLSVSNLQRMRVPIQRMSMPFKIEGFIPYLMAMRDA